VLVFSQIMAVSPYPEWQILRISSEKFTRIYPCCPDDPYEHVEYNVTIGREIREHGTATFALIILPVLCKYFPCPFVPFGAVLCVTRKKNIARLALHNTNMTDKRVFYSKITFILVPTLSSSSRIPILRR
jgi:hypothetical protein